MAKIKLTKSEKEKIAKEARVLERELLIEYLLDSDDENIIGSLDEVLMLVKLIMGEEIAKQVREHIKDVEAQVLKEKEWKREQKEREKNQTALEKIRDYHPWKATDPWDQWYHKKNNIFDMEVDSGRWLRRDLNTIQPSKDELDELLKAMKQFKTL